ncbi:MAG: hypothetical protein MI923_12060 [Phycisphaerales bacterium]|nr:hypothetical protein [Phycisphaerales bacterium]
MDDKQREAKEAELRRLKAQISTLETELAYEAETTAWVPKGYYTTYHMMAGMVLGLIAAAASLLLNVIGSAMVDNHPLELIRVYLTFPMGEKALELTSGFALAAGCCLYLATGMIGGIPFHMILSRFFSRSSTPVRFGVATILGLGVWVINFYGVLSWLQPLLIGGNWIVEKVPPFVAVVTHLVFGWTMLLVAQWGQFVPPVQEKKELAA